MKNRYEKGLLDAAKKAREYFGKFKKPSPEQDLLYAELVAGILLYEEEQKIVDRRD